MILKCHFYNWHTINMQLEPADIRVGGKSLISTRILLAFSALSTALVLGWILYYSNFGIDFSDESFYLVWMANPFLYDYSLTQFGFIYHPLYVWFDGDIASIRQANITITFLLSWILLDQLLKALDPEQATLNITRIIVAAGFAVASLITFDTWLTTPSYNSLALQALLVSSIGLLLIEKTSTKKSISGWLLIGIGGWLALMAKPSTALALTVTVILYLIVARKFSLRMVLISIACSLFLLVVSAIMIDGSVYKFINRLQKGLQLAAYLGSGHSLEKIIRIDDFQLIKRERDSMLAVALLTFIASLSAFSEKKIFTTITIAISLIFFVIIFSLTIGLTQKTAEFGMFHGLMIWAVVFPAISIGLVSAREKIFYSIRPSHWVITFIFLMMPHIYAFGTGNNYWLTGGSAAIFWLLAGVVLLGPVARIKNDWAFAVPLVLATQVLSATLLQTGQEQPYRQPQPLRLNDRTVEFGTPGSSLVLSDGYANYLDVVKKAAQNAGLKAGTPFIDLSGHSPGIPYALRVESTGQAWTIGGYPGSLKRATAALSKVSCERLSSAWILVEPDGPRRVSDELLTTFGSNLSKHYTEVATWQTPKMAGGYPFSREQVLYKPILPVVVLNACRILNKTKSPEDEH